MIENVIRVLHYSRCFPVDEDSDVDGLSSDGYCVYRLEIRSPNTDTVCVG